MALTMGMLYFAGAAIGAMTLLLPHPAIASEAGLWSNVAIAALSAVPLIVFAGRFPVWFLQITIALGTIVVTRAIYFGDTAGGFYSFWYVWVGLYVFFFFGRRWGAFHMLLMGACFGWVLTQVALTSPIPRWVMTIGTISVAGVLIDVLARRVRARADESDRRARSLTEVSATAHELARHTSSEGAATVVCEAATRAADAQAATLWVPTPSGTGLAAAASTDPELADRKVAFVGSPVGAVKAFSSGASGITHGRDDPAVPALSEYEGGSAFFQPVVHDGVPMGVLAVYWTRPREAVDADTEQVIALLGAESAIAIERASMLARLERVARTDDLTGLAEPPGLGRAPGPRDRTRRAHGRAVGAGRPRPRPLQGLQRPARSPRRRSRAQGGCVAMARAAARDRHPRPLRRRGVRPRPPGGRHRRGAGDRRAAARGHTDAPDRFGRRGPLGPRRAGDRAVARADDALYAAKRGGRDCLVTSS